MTKTTLAKDGHSGGATAGDLQAVAPRRVKNHLRNACIALLFSFAVVYALGSYIAWNLDPGRWTEDGRLIGAVLSVLGCILMFLGLERA